MSWTPPRDMAALSEKFSYIKTTNSDKAGPRYDASLPVGKSPFQLYSMATPNGQKAGIMMEELVAATNGEFQYDAHFISIMAGDQFSSGFVEVNPNSKIPAMVDQQTGTNVFETGSILLYLAEKYDKFIPKDPKLKTEMMNWIMWAQVQAFVTGNVGHFFLYAPDKETGAKDYGLWRFGLEFQRLWDLLDKHLANRNYMVGEEYSLADIAVFPWCAFLGSDWYKHKSSGVHARDFLETAKYENVQNWIARLKQRKAVQRGLLVCMPGEEMSKPWLDPKKTQYHHLK